MRLYANPAEVRELPNMQNATNEVALNMVLLAASAAIDGFCNRVQDGFQAIYTAEGREYAGSGLPTILIDEFVEVTKVELKVTPSSDYEELGKSDYKAFAGGGERLNYNRTPYNGLIRLEQGTKFPVYETTDSRGNMVRVPLPQVRVTARWGYADQVPPSVRLAAAAQASRWYKRGEAFWADAIGNNEMGQTFYRKALDPDIEMMLKLARLVRVSV